MNISQIMKEATTAANIAGAHHLEYLEKNGPKYQVYEADLSGRPTSGCIDIMLDVCGNAYIHLDGRNPLVNAIKKQCPKTPNSYPPSYSKDNWSLWKDVYKGYNLTLSTNSHRQEMSINEKIAETIQSVLQSHGIDSTVKSYID